MAFISDEDAAGRIFTLLAVLLGISLLMSRFGGTLNSLTEGGSVVAFVKNLFLQSETLMAWFYALRGPFIVLSVIVSALAIMGGWVWGRRTRALRAGVLEAMALYEQKMVDDGLAEKNPRWEHVLALASSESPGDWRAAIIEADIMLDELLVNMGHQGLSVGDKLKAVELADFRTLDQAWDAHKVRNHIAHSGSNFILTERETKRVVDLYRQVFEEFDYI